MNISNLFRIIIVVLLITFTDSLPFDTKAKPKYTESKKPNIILIIADDLGWNDIQPYGNPDVKTPHLDRLASQGMKFYGMHTATAMCSPTRMQLYSGLFPVRNGAYPNHSASYRGVKSLPQYLRPLGYRVGFAGKEDFGPPSDYPFKEVASRGELNNKSYSGIKQFIGKDNGGPYALVVGSHQPHKPWTMDNPKMYDADSLTVPPYLVDTRVTRKQMTKYYAEITYLDKQVGRILQILKKSGKENNTIVMFTSEQGPQFPFAKWTCYEEGLKTSFIVRWPRHVQPNSKNDALVEYVDVVPTLIKAAGGDPDTVSTGRKDALGNTGFDGKSFLSILVGNKQRFRKYVYGVQTTMGILNNENFYPIRSISNGKYEYIKNLNAGVKFENITKPLNKKLYPHKKNPWWVDTALIQSWFKAGKKNPNIAQRAAFYYKRPAIELYDLQKDPDELHNLAGDPHYNHLIKKLDEKLQAWMKQQGDKGLQTEMNAMSRNRGLINRQKNINTN